MGKTRIGKAEKRKDVRVSDRCPYTQFSTDFLHGKSRKFERVNGNVAYLRDLDIMLLDPKLLYRDIFIDSDEVSVVHVREASTPSSFAIDELDLIGQVQMRMPKEHTGDFFGKFF
jgi:hypothetical protein